MYVHAYLYMMCIQHSYLCMCIYYILYMLQWAYPNTEPKITGQAYALGQVY